MHALDRKGSSPYQDTEDANLFGRRRKQVLAFCGPPELMHDFFVRPTRCGEFRQSNWWAETVKVFDCDTGGSGVDSALRRTEGSFVEDRVVGSAKALMHDA